DHNLGSSGAAANAKRLRDGVGAECGAAGEHPDDERTGVAGADAVAGNCRRHLPSPSAPLSRTSVTDTRRAPPERSSPGSAPFFSDTALDGIRSSDQGRERKYSHKPCMLNPDTFP